MGVPEGSILGKEASHIDLKKLEGWAMSNSMKFNKGNWRIPHLRQGTPGSISRLGGRGCRTAQHERAWGFWSTASGLRVNRVPWQPKFPPFPGLHQAQHS